MKNNLFILQQSTLATAILSESSQLPSVESIIFGGEMECKPSNLKDNRVWRTVDWHGRCVTTLQTVATMPSKWNQRKTI